ncbi:MAG: transcriptional regulator [Gammaproteobacteria bacterium]|nr:transcriptional regulator [Gammaproteobacteria bacterium]MBU1416753.1 transcriptional regulator [Gammaproteobacteria bacterium]
MTTLPVLDPLLHQPVRTQIAAYLAGRGEATFAELKRALAATDGNLDAHLTRLLAAGYLESRKEASAAGRPQTVYSLTAAGRHAFATYVVALSALLPTMVETDELLRNALANPGSRGEESTSGV